MSKPNSLRASARSSLLRIALLSSMGQSSSNSTSGAGSSDGAGAVQPALGWTATWREEPGEIEEDSMALGEIFADLLLSTQAKNESSSVGAGGVTGFLPGSWVKKPTRRFCSLVDK